MLHLLFQSLEQAFGSALWSLAVGAYAGGLVALAVAGLLPLSRRWAEHLARGYGLQQVWIVTCPHCGRVTRTAGHRCGFCELSLDLPVSLRLWSGAAAVRPSLRGQRARWSFHLAGNLAFLLLSGWLLVALDVFRADGSLHRLFVGLGLMAWAAVGAFAGRALRLAPTGILSRARDGLLAGAWLGFFAVTAFLASEARPTPETLLATFRVDAGTVWVRDRPLPIPSGEVGFEYLQLDHELLDFHAVIPLALVGRSRVPLGRSLLKGPLVTHLRAHQDAYAARGLTVRLRTDRHRVTPGSDYDVVTRRGQVMIRRALRGTGG